MATAKDIHQIGLFSARPAAAAYLAGILYYATDTGDLWRCNDAGSDWVVVANNNTLTSIAWSAVTDKPTTFAPVSHHHSLLSAFDFQPEYAGAIFVPESLGSGTLTPLDDSTNRRNAYRWTTTEIAAQNADIIIRFRLPPSFSAMGATISVASRVSDISGNTGVQLVELLDNSGTNVITPATVKSLTWIQTSYAISGGSFAAGDRLTIRARLIVDTNDTADLGGIYLPYTAVGEN